MIVIFNSALEEIRTYRNWKALVDHDVLSLEEAISCRDSNKDDMQVDRKYGNLHISVNPDTIQESPPKEIIFNTGRYYGEYNGESGQVIHAKIVDEPLNHDFLNHVVHFSDKTRNITGRVEVFEFAPDDILDAYDRGGYSYVKDFTLEKSKI